MPTAEAVSHSAGTPAMWRVAAVLMLGGGTVLGFAASRGEAATWLVGGFAALVASGLVPMMRGSRRPPLVIDGAAAALLADLPSVTVLVAGRDEAAVLPALIGDLARQDLRSTDGRPKFDVVVIDDRSTDGTAAAVRAAASDHGISGLVSVVRREGPGLADGKSSALTAGHPERAAGEVIVVLDADARLGSGFLRTAATYVAAGLPALTARRRVIAAETSTLATIQEDEETQDGELQRGRWATGGCPEFRGNGMVIRRDLLASLGGFRAGVLTEDLDLSTRLLAREGIAVAWALDLVVYEEAVPTWRGLWRQRLRWSEGSLRRYIELGPSAVRSPRLKWRARFDFVAYAAQLTAPPIILGALAGSIMDLAPGAATLLIGIYLLAGGSLAFDALRWTVAPNGSALPIGERFARSARVAMFSSVWLIAIPGSLWRIATRRGETRFDKTERGGGPVNVAEPMVAASGSVRPTGTPNR